MSNLIALDDSCAFFYEQIRAPKVSLNYSYYPLEKNHSFHEEDIKKVMESQNVSEIPIKFVSNNDHEFQIMSVFYENMLTCEHLKCLCYFKSNWRLVGSCRPCTILTSALESLRNNYYKKGVIPNESHQIDWVSQMFLKSFGSHRSKDNQFKVDGSTFSFKNMKYSYERYNIIGFYYHSSNRDEAFRQMIFTLVIIKLQSKSILPTTMDLSIPSLNLDNNYIYILNNNTFELQMALYYVGSPDMFNSYLFKDGQCSNTNPMNYFGTAVYIINTSNLLNGARVKVMDQTV